MNTQACCCKRVVETGSTRGAHSQMLKLEAVPCGLVGLLKGLLLVIFVCKYLHYDAFMFSRGSGHITEPGLCLWCSRA